MCRDRQVFGEAPVALSHPSRRNVVAKVADADQAAVKGDFWAIFDIPEHIEPGEALVAVGGLRAHDVTDD